MRAHLACLLTACSLARNARASDCEDGWFCEREPEGTEARRPQPSVEPPQPPQASVSRPSEVRRQDSEPVPVEPALPVHRASERELVAERQQGLLMRVSAPLLGSGLGDRWPLMAGLGAGYRYRPLKSFALDVSFDVIAGRDAIGASRTEGLLSGSSLVFFNPQDQVRVFVPAGLFHSWASVSPRMGSQRRYRYVGAFIGLGLGYELDESWEVGLDLLAFIRGRADRRAQQEPEFVDERTGEATNSSGGVLTRLGSVFYF